MNKVKPTAKQRKAFENIERGMGKRDALISAGYSARVARSPKQNVLDSPGYRQLVEEYQGHLRNAGISLDILSEVQAEGLFDQDARVRLEYLKETKRDFGLREEGSVNISDSKVVVLPSTIVSKYGTSSDTGGSDK